MDQSITISAAELSVAIGFPSGHTLPTQTALSLAKTVKACAERRIPIDMACIAGSSVVTWARDKVLDMFLAGNASHLFWVDSDITWEPASFLRLLVLATKYGVVSGVYAQKTDDQTIVLRRENLTDFHINEHGLIKFQGCGLGFTVITREVAEKLAATKPLVFDPVDKKFVRQVFRLDTITDHEGRTVPRGEDMAFFADLAELGCDIYLDPSIQLGHVGSKTYKSNPIEALGLESAYGQEAQVA